MSASKGDNLEHQFDINNTFASIKLCLRKNQSKTIVIPVKWIYKFSWANAAFHGVNLRKTETVFYSKDSFVEADFNIAIIDMFGGSEPACFKGTIERYFCKFTDIHPNL